MMAFEIVCFFLLDGRECGMMVETTRCVDVSIIRPVVSWVVVFLMNGRVILIYGWCCVCGLGSLFYHVDERHSWLSPNKHRCCSTKSTYHACFQTSHHQPVNSSPAMQTTHQTTLHPPPFPPHHPIPRIAGMPHEVAVSRVPVGHVSATESAHWTCFLPSSSSHPTDCRKHTPRAHGHGYLRPRLPAEEENRAGGRRVILKWPGPGWRMFLVLAVVHGLVAQVDGVG